MRFSTLVLAAATGTVVHSQRPKDEPICDYYVKALLKNNTAENQATLLTLLVNTVVIGNYTMPNVGIQVPGILAPGEIDGKKVNLAPYFTGALASTNTGGKTGASVNFLDGGGAEPLKNNKPANDNSSKQYFLLTHLYQFFGSLLGCSMQGMAGFDAYSGHASQYEVHKFMDLGKPEMDYFITQVGLAAASFGVAKDDITAVADALNKLFNRACSPPATVIKSQGEHLQAICIDQSSCLKADNPQCDKYAAAVKPQAGSSGNATMGTGGASMPSSTGGSSSASPSSPSTPTGAAAADRYSFAAAAAALVAFLL
ncbi:hypothetical protein E4U43_007066 [Claviceps pusilla]|uniref:Uncharacterized protein n=1 Tax=Claviceps pusilla TaxID=123648 RepID=A0A9P7NDL5_9HYPO|nr:hypothetical protein E4U43_007066 [Claviceps pusilla]